MSNEAFDEFNKARNEQSCRNDARRIRTLVTAARNQADDAGARWPFELLQNALDAGPVEGYDDVTILLSWDGVQLVFEHTGAPFLNQDLPALLSGGSSKEFEASQKTGRFGTGFLVTHVLAHQVRLTGVLRVKEGLEKFDVRLDRAGDEGSILRNIAQCDEAITSATPLTQPYDCPSARFEYLVDNQAAAEAGVKAFVDAIPYVFASCPNLGPVTIQNRDGSVQTWKPSERNDRRISSAFAVECTLNLNDSNGSAPTVYRCVRVSMTAAAESSVLLVLKQDGEQWQCLIPRPNLPRIFCRFPLRSTQWSFLNIILDGRFDVRPERDTVNFTDRTKALLSNALLAIPIVAEFASTERYINAHRLALVGPLRTEIPISADDKGWWSLQLASVARRLASLPLVETPAGMKCALNAPSDANLCTSYILPRLYLSDPKNGTTMDRYWPLVVAVADLHPPIRPIVEDWSEISRGWADLGLELRALTLESLAKHVKSGIGISGRFPKKSDVETWLVRFIDVVGECWVSRKGESPEVLDSLLPNKQGRFCLRSELSRADGGWVELVNPKVASVAPVAAHVIIVIYTCQ